MEDPWKYLAFPICSVTGYYLVEFTGSEFQKMAGLSPTASELVLLSSAGLLVGLVIDLLIPGFFGSGGGGELEGDMGGDLDSGFDSGGGEDVDDIDFE
ncbi:MAG: hypothetical protein ABEK01_04925 [Candidatus Nanohaloarchaea archaeon]